VISLLRVLFSWIRARSNVLGTATTHECQVYKGWQSTWISIAELERKEEVRVSVRWKSGKATALRMSHGEARPCCVVRGRGGGGPSDPDSLRLRLALPLPLSLQPSTCTYFHLTGRRRCFRRKFHTPPPNPPAGIRRQGRESGHAEKARRKMGDVKDRTLPA